MTQKEMITRFCRIGIPDHLFWLGAVEKAEMVDGMTFNGRKWMVYYRERGKLLNIKEFESQEDACDELYLRVTRLQRYYSLNSARAEE